MSLPKGLLAAAAAFLVATPALAQASNPPSAPVAAQPAANQPVAAPAAPSPYGDSQMRAFARATVDLQLMDPRDTAGMARAIEASGLSVEQYNQMGDAMRGDSALASRLTPYLANARAERPAIPGYTPDSYARSYHSSYQSSVHHTASRHTRSHGRRTSHATRHGHKSGGHKAAAGHHSRSSRKASSHHHATSHRKHRR